MQLFPDLIGRSGRNTAIGMAVFLFIFITSCTMRSSLLQADPKLQRDECVIVLHGLGRSAHSMSRMSKALAANGYTVAHISYSSRKHPVEYLAMEVIPEALAQCGENVNTIHFVTHSMGGILTRYYLNQTTIDNLGRVVMLSPPNQGSEIVDNLGDSTWYKALFGPSGQQLGTGPESIVHQLGEVYYPVGVITGNRHTFFDGWLSRIIPGKDDGKVAVERAKVTGMHDFLVVPYTHTFIMKKEEVIQQTLHFLLHGRFLPKKELPTSLATQ